MAHDPMDHVQDSNKFEFFTDLFNTEVVIKLPAIGEFQITKFMILELIAAGLILLIYIPLARRVQMGSLPRGRWWNTFESLLTFVRNEIAKPNLDKEDHHGHHEHGSHGEHPPLEELVVPHGGHGDKHPEAGTISQADKYVPFLWTLFLFILFCNLLGMIPFMGSPTADLSVTGALALCTFLLLHGAAIVKFGPVHYFQAHWPNIQIDVPVIGGLMGLVFSALIFLLEMLGTVIKSGVLAVRLFANMFAGHMVLALILLFIVNVGHANLDAGKGADPLWFLVTGATILGVVALSLLELFVAFLQAYVFTFLAALFLGMQINPEH